MCHKLPVRIYVVGVPPRKEGMGRGSMSTYLPEVQPLLSAIFMHPSLNCLCLGTLGGAGIYRLGKINGRGSMDTTMGMPSSMLNGDLLV